MLANKSLVLDWSLRMKLSTDIARAMRYLHARGIMHRDLTSKVSFYKGSLAGFNNLTYPCRVAGIRYKNNLYLSSRLSSDLNLTWPRPNLALIQAVIYIP